MPGNPRLSMLVTAQADQAKREIAATAQATRDLARTGPEVAAGMNAARRATKETGRETAGYRAELDQLRAKFNPLFAASKQYEAVLGEIAGAERLGALSATEAAAARDRAATSLMPVQGQMRSLAPVMQTNVAHSANLAAQFNDIGVMALAMQNPLQLALQQGTQINQVFGSMGGHREGIKGIGPALLSILSPASLATIAVIAFGTAGAQWLMSMRGETATLDGRLGDLNDTLDRMRSRLDLIADIRTGETFGNLTEDVRVLADGLLHLDRAAQLGQLQGILGTLNEEAVVEGWGQYIGRLLTQSQSPLIAAQQDALRRTNLADNYAALGAANSFDDFTNRVESLNDAARQGDVEEVVRQLRSLQEAVSGGGAFGDMSEELQTILAQLGEAGIEIARVEALWNGGATDTRRGQQMLADLQSEAAIQEAINRFGEDSVRVTELRIDAERRAFQEQLRTLDVSDALKAELTAAWEAANGIEATDMALGIARARAEASAMADEIARAVGGVQSLMAQSATALEEARIRTHVSDPVDQARQLAEMRMRSAQGMLRDGAEGLDLAALDAQVRQAGNEAAEVARLNAERDRLNRQRRASAGGAAEERDAVTGLIADLQLELDLLRETDPVQQEMLRHREVLAAATEAERAQIEALIAERLREADALQEVQRQQEALRDLGHDVLRGIVADLREGASAGDILANVLDKLADRLLDMGTNSLADILFGGRGTGGGGLLNGLLGGLLGIKANALGDVVSAPALFAYGDQPGQLGVMGEAGPEAIMPLSHAAGSGVGAMMDGREMTLGLTRLSSGKLGVTIPSGLTATPFAQGGSFGFVPSAPTRLTGTGMAQSAPSDTGRRAEIIGQLVIKHSRDFEARWEGRMQGVAAQIAGEMIGEYDRHMPARVEQISLDPAMKG